MNYWTVLPKRRSQVNIHMKFYGTSEFLHSGYVASKIHPGGKYEFWSKISQVARSLDSIVVFSFFSEVILAVTWLYYFSWIEI